MDGAVGLVMTGGGARGAYQAGVLKRIGEIPAVRKQGNPFPIIGAASAGAINASALAAACNDFESATRTTAGLWSNIKPSDVFRCDILAQAQTSLTWIVELSLGGLTGGGNAQFLLDASPLRAFLSKHVDYERIQANIRQGHLYASAVAATNYHSGKSYLFIQGRKGHPIWNRTRRVTLPTRITVDHICASCAIPLVFPPVRLATARGTAFFGDGCVRLHQPLSPVIRLGARKIVAIGVRGENLEHQEEASDERGPAIAEVLGILLNAIFLDHLAADIEHLERINELLRHEHLDRRDGDAAAVRPLTSLLIAPSLDLTEVAQQHHREMPGLIQYFVNSLGRNTASCADLMSYLLFTSKYTRELVEIGYKDAEQRIDEIEEYLYTD